METEALLWAYLGVLARQIPTFLVYLVGLILALVWMRKHPKVSVFFIIAIVILFLNSVTLLWINLWLPAYWRTQGSPIADMYFFLTIVGVVGDLIRAGAFVLILLAVFSGRSANSGQ